MHGEVAKKNALEPLNIFLKKIVRAMSGAPRLSHTADIFRRFKLLELDKLYLFMVGLWMRKSLKPDMFVHRSEIPYSLRSRHVARIGSRGGHVTKYFLYPPPPLKISPRIYRTLFYQIYIFNILSHFLNMKKIFFKLGSRGGGVATLVNPPSPTTCLRAY